MRISKERRAELKAMPHDTPGFAFMNKALPDALADIEELEAKLGQAEKDRQSSRKALDETMGWLMRCATSVGWQLGQPLGEAFKNGDALQSKLAEAVKALEGVKLELNDGCNSLDTTVSARRVEAFIDAALAKVRA